MGKGEQAESSCPTCSALLMLPIGSVVPWHKCWVAGCLQVCSAYSCDPPLRTIQAKVVSSKPTNEGLDFY